MYILCQTAAPICLVLAVYDQESMGPRLLSLPLSVAGGGGDLKPALGVTKGSLS
jgi:hypothetical protein